MVSSAVGFARDVGYAHMIVAVGCQEEEVVHHGHEMRTLTQAPLPDGNNCGVVSVQDNLLVLSKESPMWSKLLGWHRALSML